jgi:hypothetical protein
MKDFAVEFWLFIRTNKAYWLVPFLVTLFIVAGFLIVAQETAFAPLIYTLF